MNFLLISHLTIELKNFRYHTHGIRFKLIPYGYEFETVVTQTNDARVVQISITHTPAFAARTRRNYKRFYSFNIEYGEDCKRLKGLGARRRFSRLYYRIFGGIV